MKHLQPVQTACFLIEALSLKACGLPLWLTHFGNNGNDSVSVLSGHQPVFNLFPRTSHSLMSIE
jgi:hypothetical protein